MELLTQTPISKRPKHFKHEQTLVLRVCKYLDSTYPGVFYVVNYVADLHFTDKQDRLNARLKSPLGWPDIQIIQPSRGYHGLFIEVKIEGVRIYNTIGPNKGKMASDMHIRQQAIILDDLNKRGYFARFGIGFDKCKQLIDWYLNPDQLTMFNE